MLAGSVLGVKMKGKVFRVGQFVIEWSRQSSSSHAF